MRIHFKPRGEAVWRPRSRNGSAAAGWSCVGVPDHRMIAARRILPDAQPLFVQPLRRDVLAQDVAREGEVAERRGHAGVFGAQRPPARGNLERCDDGNKIDDDACSNNCEINPN